MPNNSEILAAFASDVNDFAVSQSLTIAWDGGKKSTDGINKWLEFLHIPNDYDPFLSDEGDIKRGMFQINVCGRKKLSSSSELMAIAESIIAAFPKLTPIAGTVQITRTPYTMTMIKESNRNVIPVTIEYHE